VLKILFEIDALAQRFFLAIDDYAFVSFVEQIVEKLVVLAFSSNDDRR
jgi:hypothetical protein